MENVSNIDISKLSDEECYLILFAYLCSESSKYWFEFQKEVKNNKRFFPDSVLLNLVEDMKDDTVYYLRKGDCFYRARLFHDLFIEHHKKEFKELKDVIVQSYPELQGKSFNEMSYIFNNPLLFLNQELIDKIIKILKKHKTFWGYDSNESDSPPADKATAGRANPGGISYLYMCDSRNTSILEVRPMIGQEVSVATIEVLDDIRLFDLCKEDGQFSNGGDVVLHSVISRAFSEPYSGKEEDYYPTQYLCEFIRNLGFEGIRYYSSLDDKSKDIVLFNTKPDEANGLKKYKIKKSEVFLVKGFNPDILQIAPWKE